MRFNPEEYIGVSERIAAFYAKFPEGRILTAVVEHSFDTGQVMVRAEVYRNAEDTLPAATGHAYETKGGQGANQTSHVENAETSAVGRAIANLGFEVKRQGGNSSRGGAREAGRAEPKGVQAPPAGGGTLDERKARAAEIVAAGGVSEVKAGEQWRVKTDENGRAVTFNVLKRPGDNFASCGCPDYRAHAESDPGYKCVHKVAVVEFGKS